jgi:hypothetical protein
VSRTVYLHVGIAKTGTTYLQRTLFANRQLLEEHGARYPGPEPAAHFLGSLDLRGVAFKGHVYERVDGAWDRLVAQADAFDGTTVISHETLAHTKRDRVKRAVTSFGTTDVRVVITCRDLARQIPAVWQETVKNRSETPYDEFLEQIFGAWQPEAGRTGGFWGAQDIRGVVARWGAAVGMEKVSVVTVPPPDADRLELWRRFARSTGLPELDYEFPAGDNSSLGVAEAELLRRLNPLLRDTLDWPQYDARIKKRFVEGLLGTLESRGRLGLPAERRAEVARITRTQVSFLEASGVTVVGDLGDLQPTYDEDAAPQPSELSDGELLEVALKVVSVLAARPLKPGGLEAPTARHRLGAPLKHAVRAARNRLPGSVRHRFRRD